MPELPPFIPFYAGALLAACTRGKLRCVLMPAVPVLGIVLLWLAPAGTHAVVQLMEYELVLFRVDKLSLLFGYAFHIASFIAIIFALHLRDTLQHSAGLLYAGSALGAVFAGDLTTLFIFSELMTQTSLFLIWARRNEASLHAGLRYFAINVVSGLLLLAGIIVYSHGEQSLTFTHLGLRDVGGWLILLAFGIKCAFPFLHSWVVDAYPESTATGTVFLSIFTTQTAIYMLARGYAGVEPLVYIGAVMTCFPIAFALMENDLRRVLAWSLVAQLGFMVSGIGMGTAAALNGAVAHAFNTALFMALLSMSTGAVMHVTGKTRARDLGGLYKTMPKTALFCVVGAASLCAVPLFSGFVSQSMVLNAALENGYDKVWVLLLFASAATLHYAGIKVPCFAFFGRKAGSNTGEAPRNMLAAMGVAAAFCVVAGMYPQALQRLLPFDAVHTGYDAGRMLLQLQLLLLSAAVFIVLYRRRVYRRQGPSTIPDVDWLYRKPLPRLLNRCFDLMLAALGALRDLTGASISRVLALIASYHKGGAVFARPWPTGWITFWMVVLLAVLLVLGFL